MYLSSHIRDKFMMISFYFETSELNSNLKANGISVIKSGNRGFIVMSYDGMIKASRKHSEKRILRIRVM